ncbi:MAG: agmatine deiminase family protein [Kiritimatiellaeota bacterium]|nr:agmatine deiminase family protein [Kiritimatiellota bacterium]
MKKTKRPAPAALGYRMPAEWETHEATWLSWPHYTKDWPGKLALIPWVFAEMVRKLAGSELVRICVASPAVAAQARRVLEAAGVAARHVELLPCPSDRSWIRDYGPLFVRKGGARPEVAIARFRFNGWARYRNWQQDNAVPERIARKFRIPLFHARFGDRPIVLEGGAIDVNGRGSLLTTEECLLDPVVQARNPGLGKAELEQVLRDALGVSQILWLRRGIAGRDDTHGHVDDICRFVAPGAVVLCQEKFRRDPNYKIMGENRERLEGLRLENGSRLEIIPLPLPEPLLYRGARLPASYANFYIGNAAVLVPTFNDPQDRVALGLLAELFPGRQVVGIHAVDLVAGCGAIHCLTQQQPAR